MDNLQLMIDKVNGIIKDGNGEYVINQMTSDELRTLSKIVSNLKEQITRFNKFHVNQMFEYAYEAGDNSIDSMREMRDASPYTNRVTDFVFWQQIRPAYAFERFGKGGVAIYDGFRRGQSTLAFNTKQIIEFAEKTYTAKEVKAWEKALKNIELSDGSTITLPVSSIMSFYELSKRPQALNHMLAGGVRAAAQKTKGKSINTHGHTLTEADIQTIVDTLTPRQKEVADSLQKYMAEQGGKWGNYVTVKRFGEEMFGEPTYFPIQSDGRHLRASADGTPNNATLYSLLNMSFTKELNEKANNRIVLYSIFDVFANHMASMAQYNAFALPMLDALKWFNYQQKVEKTNSEGKKYYVTTGTVREEMARAYGAPASKNANSELPSYAETFVTNILKAFNGTEAQGSRYDSTGLKMLNRYNRAQIAFNLRVVMQQPTAITRAGLILDPDALIKGIGKPTLKQNIEEMQKYSGIAVWKDLGFYDVNVSRGLTDMIKHADGFVNKTMEYGTWGAEKADLVTWAAMWSAAKEQVTKKQHLTPKSPGFYEAVTNLFEDVIYKTQVVDSVLTKNAFLRSKGLFARTVGSFMSEPTTTASMLIDAYDKYHSDIQRGMNRTEAWKKHGRMIGRVAAVFAISAIINAFAQSIPDGFRDDDDYQTYPEKWWEAFKGNAIDELMPFNKLPVVSDFYDIAKTLVSYLGVDTYGYAPQSVYMQWYDSLVKGVEIITDHIFKEDTNYTWYGGVYKLLQVASGITGLPMAAATREVTTIWNNTAGALAPRLKVKTYAPGDKKEIQYAYQDGYLTADEAMKLLLQKELADSEDDAYWSIQSWDSEEDNYSRYGAIYEAVLSGTGFDEAMAELTSHGYKEKEVLSQVKSQIGKWYRDGEITKQQASTMLSKYLELSTNEISETIATWSCAVDTGIPYNDIKDEYLAGNITFNEAVSMRVKYGSEEQEKATETVTEWQCEKDTGIAYSELKDEYIGGNITFDKAVSMRVKYGGEKQEEATETVTKWKCEKDTGVAYEDAKDEFMNGNISATELKDIYMTYGGKDEDDAEKAVAVATFVKKHPEVDGISYSTVEAYTKYGESSGISVKDFYEIYKYCNTFTADYDEDGNAISGSKKAKILEYISNQPLTIAQKDSLYYAFGYAESKLYQAPWH